MMTREQLAAEYLALIGYDPFQDDPTISESEVAAILDEYKALPEVNANEESE